MKISARNKRHGTIVDVSTKGLLDDGACSHRLGRRAALWSCRQSITNEAVDELKLKKGEKAYAVIKATDVMVGLD